MIEASWQGRKAAIHPTGAVGIPFTHRQLTSLYDALFDESFNGDIAAWMKGIGRMFEKSPELVRRYQSLYDYYNTWLELGEPESDPWTAPEEWYA